MKPTRFIPFALALFATYVSAQSAREFDVHSVMHPTEMDIEAEVERDAEANRLAGMRKDQVEANRASRRETLQLLKDGFEFKGKAAFYSDDRLVWSQIPVPLVAKKARVLHRTEWSDDRATFEGAQGVLSLRIWSPAKALVSTNLGDRYFLGGTAAPDATRTEANGLLTLSRPHEVLEVETREGEPTRGRLYALRGASRALVVSYEASADRIVVTRLRGNGVPTRTETYTPTGNTVPVDTSIEPNQTVSDFRLGEDKQVVYDWTGKLPTLDELESMRTGLNSESGRSKYAGFLTGAAIAACGVAIFAMRRRAGRVSPESGPMRLM